MNNLMKKMAGGKPVIGPFVSTSSTEVIEVLGLSGFDFCIVDGEHGPGTYLTLQNACVAGDVKDLDISIIYRVAENTNAAIGHALDVGTAGVLVPHVDDGESARKAVKAAKFYPLGDRGMHGVVRAARYGSTNINEYIKKSNEETMLMIQIEGLEGLNNIDEILDVEGIDGLFIGPYDLSQSLGIPGQVNNPLVEEKMKEIISKVKAKKENMYIGTFMTDMNLANKWVGLGVQFMSYQMDTLILANASRTIVDDWKKNVLK